MLFNGVILLAAIAIFIRARSSLGGLAALLFALGLAAAVIGWAQYAVVAPEPGVPAPSSIVDPDLYLYLIALGVVLILTAAVLHVCARRVHPSRARLGEVEWLAVALWAVGGFALGWILSFALIWTSRCWRPWEKLIGTLGIPGGPSVCVLLLLSQWESASPLGVDLLASVVLGIAAIAPAVQAVYLVRLARAPAPVGVVDQRDAG